MSIPSRVEEFDRPLSIREAYERMGYEFEEWTYKLNDGQTFTIERPIGLPLNYPYYGRRVTLAEVIAIWRHHLQMMEAQKVTLSQ